MFFSVVILIRRKPMLKSVVALAAVVSLGVAVPALRREWTKPMGDELAG
jgi:hypothetical protein